MNQKKAKALRRLVAAQGLPDSKLMQHRKSGVVVRGPGERRAYQIAKKSAA